MRRQFLVPKGVYNQSTVTNGNKLYAPLPKALACFSPMPCSIQWMEAQ